MTHPVCPDCTDTAPTTHGHDGPTGRDALDSCDEWFDRFHEYRLGLGYHASRYAWDAWISPFIGAKRWDEVTTADAERIRDRLDRAMFERRTRGPGVRRLLGRSALDIWRWLHTCVRTAKRGKRRDLRVLAGCPNPLDDIEAPGDRATRSSRGKPFIYPSEAAELFACTDIPRSWRELHAIAAYLYLRPGELLVLRWSDIDLRHGIAHIARAWDYLREKDKGPKTRAGTRDVPIPSALLPLLDRMRGSPESRVVPLLANVHRTRVPRLLRLHLEVAGVVRPALHTSTTTSAQATFRTWRDSGLTWLALAGVGAVRIARRAGHEDLRMTMRHVKQAEDLTGRLGVPFGPLPRELIEG